MDGVSNFLDSGVSIEQPEKVKCSINRIFKESLSYIGYSVLIVAHLLICECRLFSVLVMILYLLLGALVFPLIEVKEPKRNFRMINISRYELMEAIKIKAEVSDEKMNNISAQLLARITEFDDYLLQESLVNDTDEDPDLSWHFLEALSFCFVVVTTIGELLLFIF